ncbi:hypothetical protein JCM11251_001109 [Rhodosporidiobolus azoricus]
MANIERFEPTLTGLPAKLKERILFFLDSVDLYDDEDWEDDDGRGQEAAVEGDVDTMKAWEGDGGADDAVLFVEDDPEDARKSTLCALGAVSTEWNGLVAKVLWRDVFLYPCSTGALLQLVEDSLPRHAQHVEQLVFQESAFELHLEDGPIDEIPPAEGRAVDIVEKAEGLVLTLRPLGTFVSFALATSSSPK